MILQLNPEMMVYTPLGHGRTIFIIECGADMNTCWVVVLTATGEIKHFDSNDIRAVENCTFGQNLSAVPETWKKRNDL